MKKFYALTFTLLSTCAVMAQPTITSVAVPQVGYVYNMIADTDKVGDLPSLTMTAGSSSAQTWNYSSQFNNVQGETTAFSAASAGAGSSNFPGANLAVLQANNTDWIYFVGSASCLMVDGAHLVQQGTAVDIDLTPNQMFFATPSTYGYSNQATSVGSATTTASGQTVLIKHTANRTVTADAFGSLTTPTSTYPNTLRIKTYETTIDSVFFDVLGNWTYFTSQMDTTTNYMWVQNSQDALLMSVDIDKTGGITKASYLQSFSNGIANYNAPATNFGVYPNPAGGMTYFTYENKASCDVSLQMYDMNGRMVRELINGNEAIGKHKLAINLEAMHLPAGMYFLQFRNSEGAQNLKLMVD